MMCQKNAVVTGGKRGLGKAVANALRDAKINVLDPASSDLDVSNSEVVGQYFSQIDPIDLLVCNAGITADKPLARMSEADWAQVLEVNLKGAFLCAREASKKMMKQREGHIVFISSYSAIHPPVGQANYAAAKAALLGMMKSMAQELGSRNVRVNAIIPGFMKTNMTAQLSEAAQNASKGKHVLGRFNTPEFVAGFITFLHQNMPHTSGQVFNLDSRIL